MIQTKYRQFWDNSHFLITRYEVIRVQAAIRGKLAHDRFIMSLGCCIMLQSSMCRYLARKRVFEMKLELAAVMTAAQRLRETNGSKRIQSWWRVVLDCGDEKRAALVIERFFVMVKKEVDLEIQRAEKRKTDRRQRRKKRESDETSVISWLTNPAIQPPSSVTSSRSGPWSGSNIAKSYLQTLGVKTKSNNEKSRLVRHEASSPSMKLVMRHENDRKYTGAGITSTKSNSSAFSGATSTKSNSSAGQEVALEEAFIEAANSMRDRDTVASAEDVLKKYGMRSVPNSGGGKHFFSSEAATPRPREARPTSARNDRTPRYTRSSPLKFSEGEI
jgi:hypothetical protein